MKVTSQLDFTSLEEIKQRFKTERDTCSEKITAHKRYTLAGNAFKYGHQRKLPEETAHKALDYIRAIAERYPFQLRYYLARPLWKRFSEAWCETGDEERALRAI